MASDDDRGGQAVGQCWLPELSPPRRLEDVLVRCQALNERLWRRPELSRRWIGQDLVSVRTSSRSLDRKAVGRSGARRADGQRLQAGVAGPHTLRIETAAIAVAALGARRRGKRPEPGWPMALARPPRLAFGEAGWGTPTRTRMHLSAVTDSTVFLRAVC